VVFDLPSVVSWDDFNTPPGGTAETGGSGLLGRVRAEGGDFFVDVPGGDVYLLKHIIHDWNDEECIKILRNCRKHLEAAKAGGVQRPVIMIMDSVRPTIDTVVGGKASVDGGGGGAGGLDWRGLAAYRFDINMLAMTTGRERSAAEFRTLIESADLRLDRILPTPTPLSVVEAVL